MAVDEVDAAVCDGNLAGRRTQVEDAILVCVRNQDLLAIVDWSEKRLLWAWGPGELSGPHDATLLPNGNVLAFDNGLGRDWSRVPLSPSGGGRRATSLGKSLTEIMPSASGS